MYERGHLTRRSLLAALAAGVASAGVHGETGRVRLVVPYAAGSQADSIGRRMSGGLSSQLGVAVYVDNINGAAGLIGTAQLARASGDGSNLGLLAINHVITPALVKNMPFDALKDVRPLSMVGSSFMALVARSDVPANSVPEFQKLLKASPDAYREAVTVGAIVHLCSAVFRKMSGLADDGVAYRSAAQIITDMLGNHVQWAFLPLPVAIAQIRSGSFKVLAVTNATRSTQFPLVPTMAEQGLAGYAFEGWFACFAPGSMSTQTALSLHKAIQTVIGADAFRKQMAEDDLLPRAIPFEKLDSFMAAELARYKTIVQDARIELS